MNVEVFAVVLGKVAGVLGIQEVVKEEDCHEGWDGEGWYKGLAEKWFLRAYVWGYRCILQVFYPVVFGNP